MIRPTIALACILKNELENLPRLLASVDGCFDKIYLTDTGSNDGSVELIKSYIESNLNPSNTPIELQQIEWPNDFAAARNKSFEPVKEDYIMWMDLDDVMSSKQAFTEWRNTILNIADFWLATYHYAEDTKGNPTVSFARERVVSRRHGFKWKFFVHEGMTPDSKLLVQVQYATNWSVRHKRTEDDIKKDKSRNLALFEKNKTGINGRMLYYWGKELYENQQPLDAIQKLLLAIEEKDLEGHDRIMALQYASLSAMLLNQFEKAIQLAYMGLQLDSNRAELWVVIADSYIKINQVERAILFYKTATNCSNNPDAKTHGALFSFAEHYTSYPNIQMFKIYANHGNIEKAKEHLEKAKSFSYTEEIKMLEAELIKLEPNTKLPPKELCQESDEIIITCPPVGFYEWDEEIYKTRGIGGSETAVVEMARHLHKLTGKKVTVFNNRTTVKEFDGVRYVPAQDIMKELGTKIPKVHIAWRHNIKLTHGPMYVWCHDLAVNGVEFHQNYEKVLALSEFHKNYLKVLHGVPEDKILVTRNGINPDKFANLITNQKVGNRIVFSSSPDRGLEAAMLVMDEVIKVVPDAELCAYYGYDNLYKAGRGKEADRIKAEVEKRPYVKMVGNLEQTELYKELAKAKVWLYPTNFLETFCITALEMLECRVFPIVRNYGALPNTLKGCKEAVILGGCISDEEIKAYSREVISALDLNKWKLISHDMTPHSWENVAKSWLEFLPL